MSEEQIKSQAIKNALDPIIEIVSKNPSLMELKNVRLDSYIAIHVSGKTSHFVSLRGAQRLLGLRTNSSGQTLIRLARGRLNPYLRPIIRNWFENPTKIHTNNGGGQAWALTTEELLDLFESFTDAQIAQSLNEDDLILANAARRFTAAFAVSRLNLVIDQHNNYETNFSEDKKCLADALVLKKKKKNSKHLPIPQEFYSALQTLYPEHRDEELSRFRQRRFVGGRTTAFIYDQIDSNLTKKLKLVNPQNDRGFRGGKHSNYLSAYGQDLVAHFHVTAIIAMKASSNRADAIKLATLLNLPLKQKINTYRKTFELE